ncbi:MAG: hypothetical protein QOK44_4748, partial [Betaproteobacteria bacterium]|nr:hypothetical protein [Betaproteobacteria bacterium]
MGGDYRPSKASAVDSCVSPLKRTAGKFECRGTVNNREFIEREIQLFLRFRVLVGVVMFFQRGD